MTNCTGDDNRMGDDKLGGESTAEEFVLLGVEIPPALG